MQEFLGVQLPGENQPYFIAAIAVVLIALILYLRYQYLWSKYGVKIGYIGLGVLYDLRNFSSWEALDEEIEHNSQLLVRIGRLECILGRGRQISAEYKTQSLVNIRMRDIELKLAVQEISRVGKKLSEDGKRGSTLSGATAVLLLEHLGLLSSEGQLSLLRALFFPVAVIMRYLGVFLLNRLASVQLENVNMRIGVPEQKLEFNWSCESLRIGSFMLNRQMKHNLKMKGGYLGWFISMGGFFKRKIQLGIRLEGLCLKVTSNDNKLQDAEILQVKEYAEASLSFVLSRFTSRLTDPSVALGISGIHISIDAALKLFQHVNSINFERERRKTMPNLDEVMEDDEPEIEAHFNYQELQESILSMMSRLLLFSNWSVSITLDNSEVVYVMDREKRRAFYRRLLPPAFSKDLESKLSLLVSLDDPTRLKLSFKKTFVKLESVLLNGLTIDDKHTDGYFEFEAGLEGLALNFVPGSHIPSVYQDPQTSVLCLSEIHGRLEIPYGIVYLAIRSLNEGNLGEFRMSTFEISVNNLACVVDAAVLAAFTETLAESGDMDLSLFIKDSEDFEEESGEKIQLPFILPSIDVLAAKFGLTLNLIVKTLLVQVVFDDVTSRTADGDCARYFVVSAELEEFLLKTGWDQQQKFEAVDKDDDPAYGYCSFEIGVSGLLGWNRAGRYQEMASRADQRKDNPFLTLPRISFTASSTIPLSKLKSAANSPTEDESSQLIDMFVDANLKSSNLRISVAETTGFDSRLSSSIAYLIMTVNKTDTVIGYINEAQRIQRLRKAKRKAVSKPITLGPFKIIAQLKGEIKNYTLELGVLGHSHRAIEISFRAVQWDHSSVIAGQFEFLSAMTSGLIADIQVSSITRYEDKGTLKHTLLRFHRTDVLQDINQSGSTDLDLYLNQVSGSYGLFAHFLGFQAFSFGYSFVQPILSVIKKLKEKYKGASETRNKPPTYLFLTCHISKVDVAIHLPNDVSAVLIMEHFFASHDFQKKRSEMKLKQVGLLNEQHKQIFSVDSTQIIFDKLHEDDKLIEVEVSKGVWFIPHDYVMSILFDNLANFGKALKQLHEQGITEPLDLNKVATELEDKSAMKLPFRVKLHLDTFDMVFEDDPFDAKLNRIFHLGRQEQRLRLLRSSVFENKVEELKKSISSKLEKRLSSDEIIKEAWTLLMEKEAKMWQAKISGSNKTDIQERLKLDAPPLVHISARGLEVQLGPPELTKTSARETIHDLDPDTPVNLLYSTLIAVQVNATFQQFSFQLRDFAAPFVCVPDGTTKLSGLVIISEAVKDLREQTRYISLAIREHFGDLDLFHNMVLARTIIPPKIYCNISAELPQSSYFNEHVSQFTFGVALEPHMSDMNRAFSKLSPESVDPSEKLPFWDKFRLHFHGKLAVHIPEGSSFRIRLLGSRYAHDSGNTDGSGLDISLGGGVSAVIGTKSLVAKSLSHEEMSRLAPIMVELGEIIAKVPTRIDPVTLESIEENVLARLSGGVSLSLSTEFETMKQGTHADVFTRAPLYTQGIENYDSFSVIRTRSITFNVNMRAPEPKVERYGRNYVRFSHELIHHFRAFGALYTSPITLIPIRRGKIYYPPPHEPPKTQKLSRFIKAVNVQTNLQDLLCGFSHLKDAYEIGLRANIDEIRFALSLQQENFIPGRKGASWEILAADFDMTGLTVRMVQRGYFEQEAHEDESEVSSKDRKDVPGIRLSLSEEDSKIENVWRFEDLEGDEDDVSLYGEHEFKEIMEPILWAPKVIYFRHGSHSVWETIDLETGESTVPERDVNVMQLQLLTARLEELEGEISTYKETLKFWEDRIALYKDKVLKKRSVALMERLEVMFEKKKVVEDQIAIRRSRFQKTNNRLAVKKRISEPDLLSPGGFRGKGHKRSKTSFNMRSRRNSIASIQDQLKRPEYLHRLVVHNLSLLWNPRVRNIVFKFADLEQNGVAAEYFRTNSAVRILRDMIADAKLRNQDKNTPAMDQPEDDSNANLLHKTETELSASGKMAQQLLEQLIIDRDENFVVEDNIKDKKDEKQDLDPTDPAYVSPEYSIYNDFMIQCFYPQFSFETTGALGDHGCIIVCAESANVKSAQIVDETDAAIDSQLVKNRREIHIESAQFFSTFKLDVLKELGECGIVEDLSDIPWPIWVPMECLLDSHISTREFKRFVDKAEVVVQIDQCSPLYLRSTPERRDNLFSARPEGLAENAYELEHVDSVFVQFPKIVISADSAQYCAIYDVVTNVLIYNDPKRKQRNEQVNTMLFAMLKEDLANVIQIVLKMQEKIRHLENLLKSDWQHLLLLQNDSEEDLEDRHKMFWKIKHRKAMAEEELVLVMEALKRVAYQRQQKDNAKKHLRTIINAKELTWKLLQDSGSELCELNVNGVNYSALAHEDRSRSNTVEMNLLTLINHLENPVFEHLIGPFIPEGRALNFDKHKMIRVYWRELAPVAGIPIIDHFEVNIFPLLFQMTFIMGKSLIEYLYPKKKDLKDPNPKYSAVDLPNEQLQVIGADDLGLNRTLSFRQLETPDSGKLKRPRSNTGSSNLFLESSVPETRPRSRSVNSLQENVDGSSSSQASTSRKSRKFFRRFLPSRQEEVSFTRMDLEEDSDVKLMKDRASANKTFVYIKVPGSTHCLSYHGIKDANIEDLYRFVLKLPTIEYHNRTWTWLEFLMQVRNDIGLAVISQTGSLVREKLMMQRRPKLKHVTSTEDTQVDDNK